MTKMILGSKIYTCMDKMYVAAGLVSLDIHTSRYMYERSILFVQRML